MNIQNDEQIIDQINVTPFVDIMLVLLVIFMVTASFIVKEAIEVELPKAAAGGSTPPKTFTVVVNESGKTFLDGAMVDDDQLQQTVKTEYQTNHDLQAVIGADRRASHGSVMHVMDILKTEGITRFAIQIEKKQ